MNKKRYIKNGKTIKKLSTWKFSWIVLFAVAALVFSREKDISNEAEGTSTLPPAYETSAAEESVITIRNETFEKEQVSAEYIADTEEGSYFEVHFIDVGQADAALVLCDDQYLLIDGGNVGKWEIINKIL